MKQLPIAARVYLWSIWLLAASAVVATLIFIPPTFTFLLAIPLLILVFVIADYFEVNFEVSKGNAVSMTVADAPALFFIATTGSAGLIAICMGSLITDMLRRRPLFKGAFNAAERCLLYIVLLFIFTSLNQPNTIPFSDLPGLLLFGVLAVTWYVGNTILVSTVIGLASRKPLLQVYRDSFRTVQWVHCITLPFGALLTILWSINYWSIIFAIIPLIMAHRSFRSMADWQAASHHNQQLATHANQLALRLEHLQTSATEMVSSLNYDTILATASSHLMDLLNASARWVVLRQQNDIHLLENIGLPLGWNWSAQAYANALQTPHIQEYRDQAFQHLHPTADLPWTQILIIPLAVEQKNLGGICLGFREPIKLTDDDRRILQAFAAQSALVIEQARLFVEVRTHQEELVRSSKLAALGTFAAGIGHEFNNLMAGMLGYAQLAMDSDTLDEKNEALRVVVRSCLRGRSITSGLLTFARRRTNGREPYVLTEVVNDTIALVDHELVKEGITLVREVQPVSPILCDPGQISQVVLNLISNARDAMQPAKGGILTVTLKQEGSEVVITVGDTGTGIHESIRSQLFQPFVTTKGPSNSISDSGTGLGLAISYGIIEAHNGRIDVESATNIGTVMTIRLPLLDAPISPPLSLHEPPLPQLQILLVEDDPTVSGALSRILEQHGQSVTITNDPIAAFQYTLRHSFDMVITDLVMPGVGGEWLINQLQHSGSLIPVIVITGHAHTSDPAILQAPHVLNTIYKPFTAHEVLDEIRRFVTTSLVPDLRSRH
jgi:signal transduction histidine kinase